MFLYLMLINHSCLQTCTYSSACRAISSICRRTIVFGSARRRQPSTLCGKGRSVFAELFSAASSTLLLQHQAEDSRRSLLRNEPRAFRNLTSSSTIKPWPWSRHTNQCSIFWPASTCCCRTTTGYGARVKHLSGTSWRQRTRYASYILSFAHLHDDTF